MFTLVECVPNFSEGRDKAKVDALVESMKMDGVYLLDREMDSDHNRSVITLVGEREAIAEAAIRGVGKAAEILDLTRHQGAHPRLGAADVIPFIPIEGVTLQDCVTIARHVGSEIWNRYRVPVYLYEAAATIPERQSLENIRRGQFEGVREEVKVNPLRMPDFGEASLHATAGATVVGARKALVAYNIFLNTTDLSIAQKIGKAVRFSSGGLRYVKGMGVMCRGMAQVSMNLTSFEETPIARVFEFVKREAARYGVMPVSSEIVGLIPKKALEQAAEWFLQIENFDSSMILENRLAGVMSGKMTAGGLRSGIEPFLEQVAAPTAAPGGGCAAAASGAMAAALGQMVAGMSRTKKAYLAYEPQLSAALAELAQLREELQAGIDADASAYQSVSLAYKQAKNSTSTSLSTNATSLKTNATSADAASTHANAKVNAEGADFADPNEAMIEAAMRSATEVPLFAAQKAMRVMQILETLKPISNPNMASDLTTAIALAHAAIEGAIANVEINLSSLKDLEYVTKVRSKVVDLKDLTESIGRVG